MRVIAWLPGVNEKKTRLHATPYALTIMTKVRGCRYHKTLELPAQVDPEHVRVSYKNGVFEVNLRTLGHDLLIK